MRVHIGISFYRQRVIGGAIYRDTPGLVLVQFLQFIETSASVAG